MQVSRSQMALAASVTALMIAAPLAFHATQSGRFQTSYGDNDGRPVNSGKDRTVVAQLDKKAEAQNEPANAGGEKGKAEPAPAKPVGSNTSVTVGVQSQASDNTATLIAPPAPGTAAPAENKIYPPDLVGRSKIGVAEAEPKPSNGLGAVGGTDRRLPYVQEEDRLANEKQSQIAAAPPPANAPLAKPIDGLGVAGNYAVDSTVGRRMMLEKDALAANDARYRAESAAQGYNPYAHLTDVERQKAIANQEFRDKFEAKEINPVKQVASEPVSTFSIDVDTASYAFVRRALNAGRLPPQDAVRVEEMINYFPYAYPRPETAETPFQPTVTVVPSPWNAGNQLVHVAIKGYDIKSVERPRANLVFLMDVSGSMQPEDRLPLVKNAFRMLVDELKPDDTVSIVTYASGSGVLLEPTKISDKHRIMQALDQLGAGGSTAGAQGIQDAYRLAEENFDKNAVNRVILATDGDFNVGITDQNELKGLIERKREKGIFLSILGVGEGNYNDALMQTLAQNGNGTAAYADTLSEARKVLVDESSSTLFTIAKDVKIQIEWNPARVQEYRLIGYETRSLKREDFNNDKVDAGDIGSGHTVTAIYEVTPAGSPPMVDDLRYGKGDRQATAERAPALSSDGKDGELGFLKLRYKLPKEDASKLVTLPISMSRIDQRLDAASSEARFSIAVAGFGQLLKGAPYLKGFTYDDVLDLAKSAKGEDPFGYRAEFLNLVRLAKSAQR